MTSLNENKPFTIDGLLAGEHDLPATERKILYQFLSAYLNYSLEFCLRDFISWSKQVELEQKRRLVDIESHLDNLRKSAFEIKDIINKMPISWQATPITYELVERYKREGLKKAEIYKQLYYKVTNNESTYQHAICAGLDCPNREILDKAHEILKNSDSHIVIVGDGGEGKTSLLFRLAVEHAMLENTPCYWLCLSDISITSADVDSARKLLDSISSEAELQNKTACLFIDNPYYGKIRLFHLWN